MADSHHTSKTSMVDLKAELFRKQEEYKQLKAQSSGDFVKGKKSDTFSQHGRGNIWSKKNPGVLERANKDLEKKQEEEDVMERSRKALEAKSRIYDKIASASGIPDDDGSEGYLVDFQRKAVDRVVEQRRSEGMGPDAGHASAEDPPNNEPIPEPANPEEQWVDYIDVFGRSRRCMKKDLPLLGAQEHHLKKSSSDTVLKLKEGATLLSADMKRELRRQQWEKEVEQSGNGPVHYANVQFDEIRSHGTGFYQFSKDSNLREEQMDMLNRLREQTTDARQRSERIKEKRKAALEARLAKVKQRRRMKAGFMMGMDNKDEDEEKRAEDSVSKATTVKLGQEKEEAEPLIRDDSWRQSAPVREWDIGKEKLPEWNAKRYLEEKRNQRENEFAPPQFYYDKQPTAPHASPSSDFQNPTKQRPSMLAAASVGNSTDAMLKQIRNSGGVLPQASESIGHNHIKPGPGQNDNSKELVSNCEANANVAAIPMPDDRPDSGDGQAVFLANAQNRREADCPATYGQEKASGMDGQEHQWQDQPFQSIGQKYGQNQGFQSASFFGLVSDVSLPPPMWYPSHSQAFSQQPSGGVCPSGQSSASTASEFVGSSVHLEQCSVSMLPFMYPSQQGLLNTQMQQTQSAPQDKVIPPTVQSTAFKTTATVATTPKVSVVDKRFMQNREVSDEDLLGYMANASTDLLVKVEPVSYVPGIFSSSASATQGQVNTSDAYVSGVGSHTGVGGMDARGDQDANRWNPSVAQTEGVIFGVPDFLLPASDVTAKTYQPGSFMAAKVAAAQKAEEEYEAARKKKQYSSAPVMYSISHDGQEGNDPVETV